MHLSRRAAVTTWILQAVAAAILVQTLYFKFTGAPESRLIFGTLGLEPAGRIGSGVAELVAAVLLLIPPTAALGAIAALLIMTGAILSHLTRLGIVIQDDGGLLFGLALLVWLASAGVLVLRRRKVPLFSRFVRPAPPVVQSRV
jgi:uncharacterized membrane protein YphA (DoxX/SURF4 family)